MKIIFKHNIVKYFFVGGFAALSNIAVFAICNSLFILNYLLSATLSFIVATFVNYLLSIKFVFTSGTRFNKTNELLLTYGISMVGLGINLFVLFVLVDFFAVNPLFAQILALGIAFFWNYYGRKRFVF